MITHRTTDPPGTICKVTTCGLTLAMLLAGPLPSRAQENNASALPGIVTTGHGSIALRALALAEAGNDPDNPRPIATAQQREGSGPQGRTTAPRQVPPIAPRGVQHQPLSRKVLFGLLGAAGGFFLGGYVGARIEGNRCECDDPGLQGFLIGAPIGTVVGAWAGVQLAGR